MLEHVSGCVLAKDLGNYLETFTSGFSSHPGTTLLILIKHWKIPWKQTGRSTEKSTLVFPGIFNWEMIQLFKDKTSAMLFQSPSFASNAKLDSLNVLLLFLPVWLVCLNHKGVCISPKRTGLGIGTGYLARIYKNESLSPLTCSQRSGPCGYPRKNLVRSGNEEILVSPQHYLFSDLCST